MTSSGSKRRKAAGAPNRDRGSQGGEPSITHVAENYLLAIYTLRELSLRVTNANLIKQLKRAPDSENLGTSPPSVAGMLRRMEREGLIRYGEQRDIRLTSVGRVFAERIVRRHRLAERMVVDLLGLELHKAHVEAHRLEHAISAELEAKIRARLGNPRTCPFGHPIPGSGHQPARAAIALDRAAPGTPYAVDRIPEEDQQLLEYLVRKGVVPGAVLEVEEVAPYRGVLALRVGDDSAVLGLEVAGRLYVHRSDHAQAGTGEPASAAAGPGAQGTTLP